MNWISILIASFVPITIGFFWYSDHLFGNIWMRENKLTKQALEKDNMLPILTFVFLFSFFIAIMM